MDEIKIGIDFMKLGWVAAVPLVFIGIFAYTHNSKIAEFTFAIFKAFFYGMLGFYMWKYVSVKEIREVGLVTAFTSILCCLECWDNLVKVICMIIQYIKNWIKIFKNE